MKTNYNEPPRSDVNDPCQKTPRPNHPDDPWPVDITGNDNPSCNCKPPRPKTPKSPCTRIKPNNDNCCEKLVDILTRSRLKENSKFDIHKPKTSTKIKLANWCCDWPVTDAMAPLMALLFKRASKGLSPQNEFERRIYEFINLMKPSHKEALQSSFEAYEKVPKDRRCNIETRIDDWPDDQAIDPVFISKVIDKEIVSLGRYGVFGKKDGQACPGDMRLWEQPNGPLINEFDREMVSGPWPWVCSINPGGDNIKWYRNRDVVFPDKSSIDDVKFDLHEFSMTCTSRVNDPTNPKSIIVECKDNIQTASFASCDGGSNYIYTDPYSKNLRCLTIPTCVAGQPIALRGFNFLSLNSTIVFKKVGGGFPDIITGCDVMCDDNPPTKNASCSVRDVVTFTLPRSIRDGLNDKLVPPGRYTIEVHVPNESNFAPLPGPAPAEFVSNTVLINVIPPLDIPFQIWIERGNCYEETSGWGSDEPWFRSYTASFLTNGSHNVELKAQDIFRQDNIDSGDWIGFNPVDPFSGTFDVGGVVAIAIQGIEVDSDEAAEKQVTDFWDAYVLYFKQVYTEAGIATGSGVLSDGLKALLATGKVTATLVAGGIGLLVIAAAGFLFAAWAPADPIAYDLLVYDALSLYQLTTPGTPLPLQDAGNIGGITYSTYPKGFTITSGQTAEYRVEHQYWSDDEESKYGLDFKFNRL